MPHESPLHNVYSLRRDEGSLSLSELTVLCINLSNKVTSLEAELEQTKQTYGTTLTKLIKKVKKLERKNIYGIQEDIEIQENISDDTEVVLKEKEPAKLVEDQSSGENREKEGEKVQERVGGVEAEGARRRNVEEDKEIRNKLAIYTDGLEDVTYALLQEQLNEEETQRIARDAKIARQLHEEINKVGQERVVAKDDQAHVIDWSDPSSDKYHCPAE
ncbi:hypothetical protein Tco_1070664 [Tanacetum coccineum]|uniref:Uncharacterized protein n=1 Tax=Tanacetum coccineum TaxID=301880 RepID=A0ABQ5HNV2_9ASTR